MFCPGNERKKGRLLLLLSNLKVLLSVHWGKSSTRHRTVLSNVLFGAPRTSAAGLRGAILLSSTQLIFAHPDTHVLPCGVPAGWAMGIQCWACFPQFHWESLAMIIYYQKAVFLDAFCQELTGEEPLHPCEWAMDWSPLLGTAGDWNTWHCLAVCLGKGTVSQHRRQCENS